MMDSAMPPMAASMEGEAENGHGGWYAPVRDGLKGAAWRSLVSPGARPRLI